MVYHPDHPFTVGAHRFDFLFFIQFAVLIAHSRNIEEKVRLSGLFQQCIQRLNGFRTGYIHRGDTNPIVTVFFLESFQGCGASSGDTDSPAFSDKPGCYFLSYSGCGSDDNSRLHNSMVCGSTSGSWLARDSMQSGSILCSLIHWRDCRWSFLSWQTPEVIICSQDLRA